MEDSFFEYRDKSAVNSDESDSEFIDNSLIEEVPKSTKKKNNTVFIAESEESTDDESETTNHNLSKSVVRRSSVVEAHVISSDEDASKKSIARRQTDSGDNLAVSSSDEDEVSDEAEFSPELVPRRRPPVRPKSIDSNDSIIGRKTKKRMFLVDSDTDNSIVIEHNRHKKLTCLKDTPLKIDNKVIEISKEANKSMEYDNDNDDGDSNNDESDNNNNDESDNDIDKSDDEESKNNDQKSDSETNMSKSDKSVDHKVEVLSKTAQKSSGYKVSHESDHDYFRKSDDVDVSDGNNDESDSDGPDEDLMVMSRATRMSIMGVIPKDDESDDSDYIQSDESSRKSKDSVANSLTDLPEVTICKTPTKAISDPDSDGDTSKLTCSPFSSPLQDITNDLNKSSIDKKDRPEIIDLSNVDHIPVKSRVLNKLADSSIKENVYDDDVAIIETKSEIIALSSDDEDSEVKISEKKSPRRTAKESPPDEASSKHEARAHSDIKQYLAPASYPGQVVYVKKHVRENELNKLAGLQEDLKNVRLLLDQMDMDSLPDGGSKLIERLSGLEAQVRRQGDRVANMVVEPDAPTAEQIAKDGFEKGLSWEDIQKASNAVQPRMFGKQAMATHMSERNLIVDRLRDLHSSLASRPEESAQAVAPRLLASRLMPHQLHALAWLKWRETQRPCAGILADDMGLGKTITMISLIADDKEGKIDYDDEDDDDGPVKGKLIRGGTLVVCPASLLTQWAEEVRKHCAAHALSVALHHGAARATQPHRLATHDLVATTYNILQRDSEKNGVLMRVQWRRVILDEAHIVRNHKSLTSSAVCGLRARRRWCLTGTPVQNKDLDLFALLKFLRCSPFDELLMWKKWIDNKSHGGQERLSTIMRCILLRRTKAQLQQRGQLACLPTRTPHLTEVTLNQQEMNVYQKVLVLSKSLFAKFLHQRAEKNADSTSSSFASKEQDSEYYKMHKRMMALQGVKPVKSHEILVLLLRLRQVCCHCGLIAAMLDEETAERPADAASEDLLHELDKLSLDDSSSRKKGGNKAEENDEEPEACASATEAIRAVLSPNNPVFELTRPSSKIQAVMDCLNQNVFANKGDKAVVVSQWTSVLRLVETELKSVRVRSVTLSGVVPVPARPALIAALNDPGSDIKVMLLSLCAGGVGINLCGANHLLLLDPHWNPQLEEQAQDRIYRVGQKKDVHIYRFMCVGTVEQTIRKLQQDKLQIAENVLTGAKNSAASTLSIEDLKMLFNMGNA